MSLSRAAHTHPPRVPVAQPQDIPADEAARMTFVQRHGFEVWDCSVYASDRARDAFMGRFSNFPCAQARVDWLQRFGVQSFVSEPK